MTHRLASGRTYTFEDNFTGSSLDAAKWTMGQWNSTQLGLESDCFTDTRQASVANSALTIRCERMTTPSGRAWGAGVIATKGLFSQLYGNFSARIRYPTGDGLWPAFWLMPIDDSWPPELDVLEGYPNTSNYPSTSSPWPGVSRYAFTVHYGPHDTPVSDTHTIDAGTDLTTGWHTFEMEWRAGFVASLLDGVEMARATTNVPSVPMFMVLSHVVGNWTQLSTVSTPSPADMRVDWVRVQA